MYLADKEPLYSVFDVPLRRTTHKPFIAAPDTRRQACDLARHAQQSSLVSIADF